jgi:branched-chain amino acid transport system permease protein
VPVPELITLVMAVAIFGSAVWRCCATPTSARRCAPRPKTPRSRRPSAVNQQRNALLLAGTLRRAGEHRRRVPGAGFTLAPSQIYAWIGVVFGRGDAGRPGAPHGPLSPAP